MATRHAVLFALALGACAAPDEPVLLFVPSLEIVAGDAQVDTVARQLPNAITVRVRDSATLRARGGAIVNWVVVQGGGSVFAAVGTTNDSGIAQQRWTLGPIAGAQALEARAIDPETGQPRVFSRINAIARPGPLAYAGLEATRLHVFGDSAVVPIDAHDAYGNNVQPPLPASPDGLQLARAGDSVRLVVTDLGRYRLVLDAETLRVVTHPPAGPFVHRRTSADTVWEQTGMLAFSHWSVSGGIGSDSIAQYTVTNYRSRRLVAGVATDSVTYVDLGAQHYWGHVDGSRYAQLGIAFVLAPSTVIGTAAVNLVLPTAGQWTFAAGVDTVTIR